MKSRGTLDSTRRSTPGVLGWPVWGWVSLLAATVAGFVAVTAATVLIGLQAVSVCGEPLRHAAIAQAQRQLLVLAVAAFIPWLVVAWRTRAWVRVLLAGAVSVSPAIFDWVIGMDPATYGDFFCF